MFKFNKNVGEWLYVTDAGTVLVKWLPNMTQNRGLTVLTVNRGLVCTVDLVKKDGVVLKQMD